MPLNIKNTTVFNAIHLKYIKILLYNTLFSYGFYFKLKSFEYESTVEKFLCFINLRLVAYFRRLRLFARTLNCYCGMVFVAKQNLHTNTSGGLVVSIYISS